MPDRLPVRERTSEEPPRLKAYLPVPAVGILGRCHICRGEMLLFEGENIIRVGWCPTCRAWGFGRVSYSFMILPENPAAAHDIIVDDTSNDPPTIISGGDRGVSS